MPSEVIHIRFPLHIDGSRELARVAADLAFDFSTVYQDRQGGQNNSVVYNRFGHIWNVYWTRGQSRAVVVSCERKVEAAR